MTKSGETARKMAPATVVRELAELAEKTKDKTGVANEKLATAIASAAELKGLNPKAFKRAVADLAAAKKDPIKSMFFDEDYAHYCRVLEIDKVRASKLPLEENPGSSIKASAAKSDAAVRAASEAAGTRAPKLSAEQRAELKLKPGDADPVQH